MLLVRPILRGQLVTGCILRKGYMPGQLVSVTSTDRRQRFRTFMRRFNPTASARLAITEGIIYESPARSLFKKLSTTADLALGSQQLVVGGIGSGKTTELLLAEQVLARNEQMLPVYIDVSAETDLSDMSSGTLLASLGLHVWRSIKSKFEIPDSLSKVHEELRNIAYGYEKHVWIPYEEPDEDPDYEPHEPDQEPGYFDIVAIKGKLKPPFPALKRDVVNLAKLVEQLTAFLKQQGIEIVVIFDGLDRLVKADQFWTVAEQDLRAMKRLEISVLAAGPLSIMYGEGRQIKDYFDDVHYLPPVVADPKLSTFLFEVLRLRRADELMQPDQMQRLCLASGGVLRDLISLGRNAAENAYLDDSDSITASNMDRAIEQLGNSYLLGVGTRQNSILQKMMQGEGFSPSGSDSMELLITRRVLEQPGSRYEVHPALASVLSKTSKDSNGLQIDSDI